MLWYGTPGLCTTFRHIRSGSPDSAALSPLVTHTLAFCWAQAPAAPASVPPAPDKTRTRLRMEDVEMAPSPATGAGRAASADSVLDAAAATAAVAVGEHGEPRAASKLTILEASIQCARSQTQYLQVTHLHLGVAFTLTTTFMSRPASIIGTLACQPCVWSKRRRCSVLLCCYVISKKMSFRKHKFLVYETPTNGPGLLQEAAAALAAGAIPASVWRDGRTVAAAMAALTPPQPGPDAAEPAAWLDQSDVLLALQVRCCSAERTLHT